MQNFELQTTGNGVFEITEQVRQAVESSHVQEGMAVVVVPHTTAGVTIISFPDPLSNRYWSECRSH